MASRQFDMEDLLKKVRQILEEKLNDKIAEIEALKVEAGNGLKGGLASIPASAYYFQTWNQRILNHPVAIYYGVGNIETISAGPESARKLTCFVDVVMVDNGQTNDSAERVFRYGRALEEVAKENFGNFGFASQTTIQAVIPVSTEVVGTSDEMKIGGIRFTTTIA